MVLDGQQRLTSLYQALFRRDGVHYNKKQHHFYLEIPVLLDPSEDQTPADASFADALFFVVETNGKRVRYAGIQPRYDLSNLQSELANGCLPLSLIFDTDALAKWKQEYLLTRSENDMSRYLALDSRWDRLIKPWLDCIRSYPFPVVELRQDLPLGAICHIFEKVNSTGVPLDVFDLCTAILWAQNFRLNVEWEQTRKKMDQAHWLAMQPKPLSGAAFLQGIALLDSITRKRQHAGSGQRIAVSCRKDDLMRLDVATVQRWWQPLVDGYGEASKFLANEGVLSERILPYTTLIIPLSAMFADLRLRKGIAHIGSAWPKISRWFWCSVFTQRYSSQVESAAALDFEQVMSWVEGDGEAPDVVRTFNFRPDALQEITSIRNAVYKGILCLLIRGGAKDFGGAGALSTALFYDTHQDHHHIFPTDALQTTLGIHDPRSNTIVNKTLIGSSVNRSIGAKLPSEYVAYYSQGDKLGEPAFEGILRSHCIDPSYLRRDDWDGFVLNRREQLRQLITAACGDNVQPFASDGSQSTVIDENLDDEDGIA